MLESAMQSEFINGDDAGNPFTSQYVHNIVFKLSSSIRESGFDDKFNRRMIDILIRTISGIIPPLCIKIFRLSCESTKKSI